MVYKSTRGGGGYRWAQGLLARGPDGCTCVCCVQDPARPDTCTPTNLSMACTHDIEGKNGQPCAILVRCPLAFHPLYLACFHSTAWEESDDDIFIRKARGICRPAMVHCGANVSDVGPAMHQRRAGVFLGLINTPHLQEVSCFMEDNHNLWL